MIIKTISSLILSLIISTNTFSAISVHDVNIVKISSNSNLEKWVSQGSAFFITPDGYLATAAHVVDGTKNNTIFYDGKFIPAKVVIVDDSSDTAILKVDLGKPNAYFKLAKAKNSETETIIGFPAVEEFGFYLHATTGTAQLGIGYISIYALSCHGNSGGAVVNSNGSAVGILVIGYADGTVKGGLCSTHAGALYLTSLINYVKVLNLKVKYESDDEVKLQSLDSMIKDVTDNQKVVFVQSDLIDDGG